MDAAVAGALAIAARLNRAQSCSGVMSRGRDCGYGRRWRQTPMPKRQSAWALVGSGAWRKSLPPARLSSPARSATGEPRSP